MADIKQAAKWMQEGKRVTHPGIMVSIGESESPNKWLGVFYGKYRTRDRRMALFNAEDLLRDDWEIAE